MFYHSREIRESRPEHRSKCTIRDEKHPRKLCATAVLLLFCALFLVLLFMELQVRPVTDPSFPCVVTAVEQTTCDPSYRPSPCWDTSFLCLRNSTSTNNSTFSCTAMLLSPVSVGDSYQLTSACVDVSQENEGVSRTVVLCAVLTAVFGSIGLLMCCFWMYQVFDCSIK